MDSLLLSSALLVIASEILGVFATATFFAVATGIGAYMKGRFPGNWLIAGFFFGPLAFILLLFKGDD